jgi:hypothetical protein
MKFNLALLIFITSTLASASIKSVCRGKFSDAVLGLTSGELQTICDTIEKNLLYFRQKKPQLILQLLIKDFAQ